MRSVDIIGLGGFCVVGLGIVHYCHRLAAMWKGLFSTSLLRASKALDCFATRFTQVAVLIMGTGMASGTALTMLGVLEARPGEYPGTPFTQIFACAALVVLIILLALRAGELRD